MTRTNYLIDILAFLYDLFIVFPVINRLNTGAVYINMMQNRSDMEELSMVIDFHTHIFHPRLLADRSIAMKDPVFSLLYGDENARIIDAAGLISYIEGDGPDAAVAMSFPWSDRKLCAMHNSYMAETAEKYRGLIFPFGMVPRADRSEIKHLVKEIKDSGLYGIGEIAFYRSGMDDESIEYLKAVLEAAGDFSLPVCLHVNEPVGHQYAGKYEPSLGALYGVLEKFTDVTMILSHWGGGLLFYELMPEVGRSFKNFYYDTAASPYLYSSSIYPRAVDITGSSRILFGSDYPLLGIRRYEAEIKESLICDEDVKKIMGLNGASILGL